MTIKIGINVMGRIGRMVVRSIFETQNKNLKYQLKLDQATVGKNM